MERPALLQESHSMPWLSQAELARIAFRAGSTHQRALRTTQMAVAPRRTESGESTSTIRDRAAENRPDGVRPRCRCRPGGSSPTSSSREPSLATRRRMLQVRDVVDVWKCPYLASSSRTRSLFCPCNFKRMRVYGHPSSAQLSGMQSVTIPRAGGCWLHAYAYAGRVWDA